MTFPDTCDAALRFAWVAHEIEPERTDTCPSITDPLFVRENDRLALRPKATEEA